MVARIPQPRGQHPHRTRPENPRPNPTQQHIQADLQENHRGRPMDIPLQTNQLLGGQQETRNMVTKLRRNNQPKYMTQFSITSK